ncbi:cobalt ECF transporter T component CbiQ [Pilimelia anulata]|uniref:Cobalt ECF transporter T component CbiQ n=1 Tax=Pilimelia anulata TaxID=53371 RepID=A0A8J3BD83_9ACTN|nr:cobalt ECF transporter T component CbiQ [Pilimelia anulata]GGK06312.1 cobalt ECF transporter T component CbiQ [Pilimelia anulata]
MTGLYLPRASPVHRLAPQVKVVAAVAFTVAVVATPRGTLWPYAGHAALVAAVAAVARVPAGWLLRRSLIELPFVLFAVLLPFVAAGPRVTVAGVPLAVDGLYGGAAILAEGTLGVLAALLLAASTTPADLIVGLDRLRCPPVLTQIAAFMLRYLGVLRDEARRMRIARLSRGDDPRLLWQARGFARGVGALFVRAYSRGERVHLAMLARGYAGRPPDADRTRPPARQWPLALLPAALAAAAVLWAIH